MRAGCTRLQAGCTRLQAGCTRLQAGCTRLQAIRCELAEQLSATMEAVHEAVQPKASRAQLEQVAEGSTRALEAAAGLQAALDTHAAAAHAALEDGAASARGLQSELRHLQGQLAAAAQQHAARVGSGMFCSGVPEPPPRPAQGGTSPACGRPSTRPRRRGAAWPPPQRLRDAAARLRGAAARLRGAAARLSHADPKVQLSPPRANEQVQGASSELRGELHHAAVLEASRFEAVLGEVRAARRAAHSTASARPP